jgi:hypothetical protein
MPTLPASRSALARLSLVLGLAAAASPLQAVNIVINSGATLAANTAALAAFNRAAVTWENYLMDPITVTIQADLASLGSGILGQASSVLLADSFSTVRNRMVADNNGGALEALTDALPTSANAFVPVGRNLINNLSASKANLKALGFTGLDATFGVADATITFSTNFNFDYDNSNGVTGGFYDFESVAVHEIGHALGFFSAVDSTTTNMTMRTLDLFRFGNQENPTTLAEFTTAKRELRSGSAAYFDIIDPLYGSPTQFGFSTGTAGDGRQASHWKDDSFGGGNLGIMDPTMAAGFIGTISQADLMALDVIGWDVNYAGQSVPDAATPATWVVALLGLGAIARLTGRRR